jgi:hypothetical protein
MAHQALPPNLPSYTPQPAPRVARKRRREGPWVPIVARESSTPADTWTEELCVRAASSPGAFHVAVCGTYRGRLRPMTDDSVEELTGRSPRKVEAALGALGWSLEALPYLQEALQAMSSPGGLGGPYRPCGSAPLLGSGRVWDRGLRGLCGLLERSVGRCVPSDPLGVNEMTYRWAGRPVRPTDGNASSASGVRADAPPSAWLDTLMIDPHGSHLRGPYRTFCPVFTGSYLKVTYRFFSKTTNTVP